MRWVPLFETGHDLVDLGPYVPCVDDDGVVAFTAGRSDGSAVVVRSDGATSEVLDLPHRPNRPEGVATLLSHPDGDGDGGFAVYARLRDGRTAVVRAGLGARVLVASGDVVDGHRVLSIGPTGPSVAGERVAFRAELDAGPAVLVHGPEGTRIHALDSGLDGVPIVNRAGVVTYRASNHTVVRGGDALSGFAELGRFPCLASDGSVGIAARRLGEGWTWLRWLPRAGDSEPALVEELVFPGSLGFVRGGVVCSRGRLAVYAVPSGGTLGVVVGSERTRVLALGDALFGGVVADFALNPVSASETGWLAVRVRLHDGRGFVLRSEAPVVPW